MIPSPSITRRRLPSRRRTWPGSRTEARADYTLAGSLNGVQTDVDLYWSPNKTFDASATPAHDASGNPAKVDVLQAHTGATTFTAAQLGTPPQGTKFLLAVADPLNKLNDPTVTDNTESIAYAPDVSLDSVSLDAPTGNVLANYTVTGNVITTPTTVKLYWASGAGTSLDDRILTNPDGSPLPAPASVPLDGSLGSHVATFTPAMVTAMGPEPVGVTMLMAVADPPIPATLNPPSPGMPNGLIDDPTEGDNFKSLPIPDVVITPTIQTLPDGDPDVNYSVNGNLEGDTTNLTLYVSDKPTFDSSDPNQVKTSFSAPVQQAHTGSFDVALSVIQSAVNDATKYILAVIPDVPAQLQGSGVGEPGDRR